MKYEGLTKALSTQRVSRTVLTFAEIEAACGVPLPKSAVRPQFWENPENPAYVVGIKRAIREAGWRSYLEAGKNRVRFERVD